MRRRRPNCRVGRRSHRQEEERGAAEQRRRGGTQRKSSLANDIKEPGNGGVDSDLGQEAQRQRRPSHRSSPSLLCSCFPPSSPPFLRATLFLTSLPSQRFPSQLARPYMCLTPVNQWHVALIETRPRPPPPPTAFSLVQLINVFNLLKEDEFEDGLFEMLQHFLLRNNSQKNPPFSPALEPDIYQCFSSGVVLSARSGQLSWLGWVGGRRDTGVRVSVCKRSMCLCLGLRSLRSGESLHTRTNGRLEGGGVGFRDGGLGGG